MKPETGVSLVQLEKLYKACTTSFIIDILLRRHFILNPLVLCVLNIGRLAKILISI